MTRNTAMIGNDTPRMKFTVTPRQFAAAIGVLIAGLVVLLLPVTAEVDQLFGPAEMSCGSALVSDVSGVGGAACDDALLGYRIGGWALAAAGVLVVAGALFVHTPSRQD